MPQQIIIAEQMRIAALLTDERIEELIFARGRYQVGDIYLGTVKDLHRGLDAAFVQILDGEKNGFLPVSELGPLRRKKDSAPITELLDFEQKVLVQVIKEPTGNKGPSLTGNLSLPGRYLILKPYGQDGPRIKISKSINTETEKNRLKAIGTIIKPVGTELVIRTEAQSVNEELLIDDLESLLKQWESILQDSEKLSPPILLYRDKDFIHKILRDHLDSNISRVVIDNENAVQRVEEFLTDSSNIIIEAHKESKDLINHYKINLAIQNALQPRVDLPSGGYIIIEPTEALTVIDVNSGSGNQSTPESTMLWTNCEAATEIARQLKIRNIAGVIIVDFIDMTSKKDQLKLLEHFIATLRNDSARPQIHDLTELGLVELTRKRQGQNIYELFSKSYSKSYELGNVTTITGYNKPTNNAIEINPSNIISNEEKSFELDNNEINNSNFNESNNQNSISLNSNNSLNPVTENESNTEKSYSESISNKQKTELIAVRIKEEEEEVFSNLGLNPGLLIEDLQPNSSLIAHIVRPGENSEEIIRKAKDKLSNNSTKQRKKNRYSQRNQNKTEVDNQQSLNEEALINSTENEELIISSAENEEALINSTKIEEVNEDMNLNISSTEAINQTNESDNQDSNESDENEIPRRKRRRSSASS